MLKRVYVCLSVGGSGGDVGSSQINLCSPVGGARVAMRFGILNED